MQKCYVTVYRPGHGTDFTNNGITSKNDYLYLYKGERSECIADAEQNGLCAKSIYLVERMLWGEKHYFAEPLVEPNVNGPHMAGGNFVYSCDSRYHQMTKCDGPLPVHDRYETWAQYDALSK